MSSTFENQCKQILRGRGMEPISKLGKGAFGCVFLVSTTIYTADLTSKFIAVKCINVKKYRRTPGIKKFIEREIKALQVLKHQNIVEMYDHFIEKGWIFIAMEYCDAGTLEMIQHQRPNAVYPIEECISMIIEIVSGVIYLHRSSIIHRDLKPQNIMKKTIKDQQQIIKIGDFGFSMQIGSENFENCGTPYFMAPELLKKQSFDQSVDVWSIGVMMYYMLFGNYPFEADNLIDDIQRKCVPKYHLLKNKSARYNIQESSFSHLCEIFQRIFIINPSLRITLSQLLPMLENIVQLNLENQITQTPSFEMQKINFLQSVLHEIRQHCSLQISDSFLLNNYVNKACLSFLLDKPLTTRLERETLDRLIKSEKRDYFSFDKHFNDSEIKNLRRQSGSHFNDFKDNYRAVVGHYFRFVHKQIKDLDLQVRLKLKIFCLHCINRIFDTKTKQKCFSHFYAWSPKRQSFQLDYFKQWIDEEQVHKIYETLQTLNNKFYKK